MEKADVTVTWTLGSKRWSVTWPICRAECRLPAKMPSVLNRCGFHGFLSLRVSESDYLSCL